jgi:hypothetical protein
MTNYPRTMTGVKEKARHFRKNADFFNSGKALSDRRSRGFLDSRQGRG